MAKPVSLQLSKQQFGLLVKVILLQLLHEALYLDLLLLNQVIQRHLHPHEHSVHISSFLLHSQILLPVEEIVFCFEFAP